ASAWCNAQPVYRAVGDVNFVLAHNGNLVNTAELVAGIDLAPSESTSDSDVVAALLAAELADPAGAGQGGDPLERALVAVLPRLRGAFSFVLADQDRLIGIRDPNGFHPLFLGRLPAGWVLASETPALDVVGAETVREIGPGEVVIIDRDGVCSR